MTGAAAVAGPVPIALIAATLKVYVWPGVRPPTTVNGVRVESAHSAIRPVNRTVGTPGAVISYPRIGAPPVFAGGRQRTDTAPVPVPLPTRTETLVGAAGAVPVRGPGVTAAVGSDAGLSPRALCAVTVKVYAVPSVSPGTTA